MRKSAVYLAIIYLNAQNRATRRAGQPTSRLFSAFYPRRTWPIKYPAHFWRCYKSRTHIEFHVSGRPNRNIEISVNTRSRKDSGYERAVIAKQWPGKLVADKRLKRRANTVDIAVFNDVSITRLRAYVYLFLGARMSAKLNGRRARLSSVKRKCQRRSVGPKVTGKLGSSLWREAAPSSLTAIAVKYARCRI